jgi:hypothetical protein
VYENSWEFVTLRNIKVSRLDQPDQLIFYPPC